MNTLYIYYHNKNHNSSRPGLIPRNSIIFANTKFKFTITLFGGRRNVRGAVHFIIGKTDIDINLGTVTGIAPYLKSARIS